MPKVSIIVPVYNKSEYIGRTIESILNQTYKDYEVLIINDGSTDNSLEIIKKYQCIDSRVRVFDIPNGGVSNARNIGLENANGKWIQFIDGDDLIDSHYLERAVSTAENNNVEILFSNFQMIDDNGKVAKEMNCPENGIVNQNDLGTLFIQNQYISGFFGFISNKLISKNIIEKSNAKFRKELKLAEDLDFYAQVYPFVEKTCFSNINSFYYLQTENNYIYNDNIDYFSQLTVHLDIREWFIKNDQYEGFKNILDKKVAEYVYYSLFYAKERAENIKSLYQKITADNTVIDCIDAQSFSGFQKRVLTAVKNKKYIFVKLLLDGRYFIREIYRRLKR